MSMTTDTKYTTYSLHFADFDPALFADSEASLKVVSEKLADLRRAAIADNVTAALEMYEQRGAKSVRSSAGRTKKGVFYRINGGDIDVRYFPRLPRGKGWWVLPNPLVATMDEMEKLEKIHLEAAMSQAVNAKGRGDFPQDISEKRIARHFMCKIAQQQGIYGTVCDLIESERFNLSRPPFIGWMEERYLARIERLLETGQVAPRELPVQGDDDDDEFIFEEVDLDAFDNGDI